MILSRKFAVVTVRLGAVMRTFALKADAQKYIDTFGTYANMFKITKLKRLYYA